MKFYLLSPFILNRIDDTFRGDWGKSRFSWFFFIGVRLSRIYRPEFLSCWHWYPYWAKELINLLRGYLREYRLEKGLCLRRSAYIPYVPVKEFWLSLGISQHLHHITLWEHSAEYLLNL
ncbi:hypothetical protein ES703_32536 [subsurface metagenome]